MLGMLAAVLGVWQWSVRGRERVLALVRATCRDLQLQCLDDSVALTAVRLVRNAGWMLERRYEFEFSVDGADRRNGQVVLCGSVPDTVHLELPAGPLLLARGTLSSPDTPSGPAGIRAQSSLK